MAENKREVERSELYKGIWAIANDLRGSVDGWDFKQYVLGMLFYRYISENQENYINKGEEAAGNIGFKYSEISDEDAEQAREEFVQVKGFFILPSQLFCNVRKNASSDPNINEKLGKALDAIEASARGYESEEDFKGLFNELDVNSNKLGATVASRNSALVKLMNGIGEMDFGYGHGSSIDAFGDAYEYLMGMYASNAGKSGGEYFTPPEASMLLAHLALYGRTEVNKVYDPACGSGSLLLKFAKILGKENVRMGFYGQEISSVTSQLCKINMFLHDVGPDKFDIKHGDTLTEPHHWDEEPFEAIVSNPPYSVRWIGDGSPTLINDPRFAPAGVLAPKSKADFAFILHSLSWLSENGVAAIVCFPGIMYRGGAEQKIRQYLIDNNYVEANIQLPGSLFYGTSISTNILVLKKNKKASTTVFVDASKECVKVTNGNKLTDDNIANILKAVWGRQDVEHMVKVVPNKQIAENGYNLSVSSYVEQKDLREVVDITELNERLETIVTRAQQLRDKIAAIIDEIEVEA